MVNFYGESLLAYCRFLVTSSIVFWVSCTTDSGQVIKPVPVRFEFPMVMEIDDRAERLLRGQPYGCEWRKKRKV